MLAKRHTPYKGVDTQLILRDHLAIDRTRLANERTLLAWWRTGLTMLIAGVTLIKLFPENPWMMDSGYALVPVGFVTLAIGAWRYWSVRTVIDREDH